MDITRNQWFLAGLVLLFLGIQFRMVDTFTLTPKFTAFLAEQTDHPLASVNEASAAMSADGQPTARKVVKTEDWMGWSLVALGATLVLHSLSLPRPG